MADDIKSKGKFFSFFFPAF
uniref:Uncharacterized protein n=1 Tax=Brugia malayi TaxID=6279 RepID=A8P6K3_BRUMA